MRHTGQFLCRAGITALAFVSGSAWGNVFNMPPGLTSLETVTVGNPGNAPDTRFTTPGYGSVDYTYNIDKYEVTAGQYTEFLNKVAATDPYGLYNPNMWLDPWDAGCRIQQSGTSGSYVYSVAPEWANRPVNHVSFWDACRFANWLHNGQPSGSQGPDTTETGAYTLGGYNGDDGRTIQRNANWKWAVTSEDEWYKGAYYDAATSSYFDYPTGSNTRPGRDLNDVSGNNANYIGTPFPIDAPYYTTVAGEFENSDSPYGTFDQGGNVLEWNEALSGTDPTYAFRCARGGSYNHTRTTMHMAVSFGSIPLNEYTTKGFRVVQVPEPAAAVLLTLGCLAAMRPRRQQHPMSGQKPEKR
jgi:sulfatase modifying factor 1